jgi:hypothetical protein
MAKSQRGKKKGVAKRAGKAAPARRAGAARKRASARRAARKPGAKRAAAPTRAKAAKKTARRAAPARKAARKITRKTARKTARKTVRPAARATSRSTKAAKQTAAVKVRRQTVKPSAVKTPARRRPAPSTARAAGSAAAAPVTRRPPGLDRERRTMREAPVPSPPSSLVPREASAARTGAEELRERLSHTPSGPELTAGDVDADWNSAATVGDEAPGGDNPTPDQDVVDEIGRALGVEYDDDEELQGGAEIAGRDRARWELDPASSDDFDER